MNNTIWFSLGCAFVTIFAVLLLQKMLWSPSSDYQHFIGAWRLVSITYADGRENKLCGSNPIGYIMYTKDGHMSVQIMRKSRTKFHSDKFTDVTPKEAETLWGDYFAYAGSFVVDKKQKIVTHHVETDLFPNDIGKALERRYRFEGDKLYLTTVITSSDEMEQTLTWQRVK